MNHRILYKGSDIKTDVVSYERTHNICSSIGTLILSTVRETSDFKPYEVITIEENGITKGKYYIGSVEHQLPDNVTTITCQDATKRLADYFIPDITSSGSAPSYTRVWIEKYLQEAGVNYTFDVSDYGTLVANDTSFGRTYALGTITDLLLQSGWYMHTDTGGTIHIGKISIDMNNVALDISDNDILHIDVNKNDGMLRNKVIVWGAGNIDSQDYVFAHMEVMTPWNRDANDYRSVVLNVPLVRDNATAAGLASQVLHETQQITNIKEVTLPGYYNIQIGDTVFVDSEFYFGACIVTTLKVQNTGKDAITILTLDERCPKIIGYYDYGDYVYIGTHGSGVWRKHLMYDHTWTNYSTGLTNLDVVDLAICGGVLACVTSDGKLYIRKASESSWIQFSALGVFLDENGVAHGTNDSSCVACAISRQDNHIFAVFNLNGQVQEGWAMGLPYYQIIGIPRSWMIDFTNRYVYKASLIQVTDYNVYSFDIDHTGLYPYISAIYRAGDFHGLLDWDDPNPRFTRYGSLNSIPVGSTGEAPGGGWWSDQYKGHGFGSHNKYNYGGYMGSNIAMLEMPGLHYTPSIKPTTYRGALSEQIMAACAHFDSSIEFVDSWGIYAQDLSFYPGANISLDTDDSDFIRPFSENYGVASSIGASFFIEKVNYSQKHRAVMLRVYDYISSDSGLHRFGIVQYTLLEGETTVKSKTLYLGNTVESTYGLTGIQGYNVETESGFVGWFSGIDNQLYRYTYSSDSISFESVEGTSKFVDDFGSGLARPFYSRASGTIYLGVNADVGCYICDDNGNLFFRSETEKIRQISTNAQSAVAWVQEIDAPKNNRIIGLYGSTGRDVLPSGTGFSLGKNGDDLTGDYIAKANFGGGAKLYRFTRNFVLVPSGSLYSTSTFEYPSVFENCVVFNDDFNRDTYDSNEEESSGAGSFPIGGNKGSGVSGWFPYGVLRPTLTGGFGAVFMSSFRARLDTSKSSPVVVWGDGAAHGWMNISDSGDLGTYKDVYPSGWFMTEFMHNGPVCYDMTTYSGGTGNSYYYRRILYPVGNTIYNYSINNNTVFSGAFTSHDSEEGCYHAFPYEVTTVEATNTQDSPYLFVGTSGTTPHFYQRDPTAVGIFPPAWVEYSTAIPSGHISVIRVDDRI
jgi:hypothetical protein